MRIRRFVPVLLLALALASAGCAGGIPGCGTAVPDVKGKTPAQAEAALKAAGFAMGAVKYDPAAEGVAGAVVAQVPAAGTQAAAGSAVDLTVAGQPPVKVPVLIGLTKDAAAAALAAEGLTLGNVAASSSATVVAGAVMAQSPAAGADAQPDSSVDVVVSTGPAPVAVPAVTGKTYASATALLESVGFKATRTDKADAAPAGTVIAQTPEAGAMAVPGTVVALTVSTGVPPAPSTLKVPYLKSLKLQAAKDKLASVGLKWKHVLGPGDGMLDVGYVYKQVPAPNTVVAAGSTVTIYTWAGP